MVALIVLLILLALLLGGVGLAVKGLIWLLLVALLVVLFAAALGFNRRGL